MLQSPKTNTKFAIRPKKTTRSMLVSIPVNHENKWYTNFHCNFFRFSQWTQWQTVRLHQLFSHRLYWLSFCRLHKFSSVPLVPYFMFKLLGGRRLQGSLLTYLLTPWSRVLLEKLTGSAASQEIPRIFGTRRFITVPTSARHLSLSWARKFTDNNWYFVTNKFS